MAKRGGSGGTGLLMVGVALVGLFISVDDDILATTPVDNVAGGEDTTVSGSSSSTPLDTLPDTPTTSNGDIDVDRAWQQLADLETKGKAGKGGYDRDLFGEAWTDDHYGPTAGDGCLTRDNLLAERGTNVVMDADGCRVQQADIYDAYGDEMLSYERGNSEVDLDHVVALGNAWETGAMNWDEMTRRSFANDPNNLIFTSASLNRQKGDGDSATWQVPNKAFRCEYAATQITVKHEYDLWVTKAEREALEQQLNRC